VAATHGLEDPHPSVEASKISFLSGIPVGICQPLGRVSFAFTLLEVMGTTKTRRRTLYFIIVLQFIIVGFVGLVLGYGLGDPLRVFWTLSLSKAQACLVKWHTIIVAKWQNFQNGKGLSEYSAWKMTLMGSPQAWDALSDFALALFPVLIIKSLQMRRSLKTGLILLMSLGVL